MKLANIRDSWNSSRSGASKKNSIKKSSINEQLLRKMANGLISFTSNNRNQGTTQKLTFFYILDTKQHITDDASLHRFNSRKQSQPRQAVSSSKIALTTFSSPKNSWANVINIKGKQKFIFIAFRIFRSWKYRNFSKNIQRSQHNYE